MHNLERLSYYDLGGSVMWHNKVHIETTLHYLDSHLTKSHQYELI